jgi:ParB-like partition proteins
MVKQKRSGLGRGLDAIFLDNTADINFNNTLSNSDNITFLRVTELEPRPDQPRKSFDNEALAQLADSIATHGLIQPIIVRASDTGFFRIIAGERRWRAAKMAGLIEIPVIVMDINDKKAAEIALIENIQREDLNAIEEALAYRTLMTDYNLTQEEVSKSIGRSRSAVANSLRLLDLPDDVMSLVVSDKITAGHARALLALGNADDMSDVADLIIRKELSVRETEELVRSMNRPADKEAVDAELPADKYNSKGYKTELESRIAEHLGRKIKISDTGKRSRIEIEYTDNDDLESIIKMLCGDSIFDDLI